jgi:hypothetical protein
MKSTIYIVFILSFNFCFSQDLKDSEIKLSEIKFCGLTITDLKNKDKDLKEINVIEMDVCSDGFVTDNRFQNRIGYTSKLFPGVIFQKYRDEDIISKIRLTKNFKGYLPDGNYIDMSTLNAKSVLEKYPTLNTWNSKGCSDYWSLTNEELYFYVKIEKNKEPRYPVDTNYYSTKPIEGVDIVIDCYKILQKNIISNEPLFVLDDKIVSKKEAEQYSQKDIDNIIVLKDQKAIDKYGEKGKFGVIIITTKIYLKNKQN